MERPPRGDAGSRSDKRKGNVPEAAATPNSGAGSDQAPSGQELLTLCFRTGGRGAGLGALRQCTSHRREISAQLLPTAANPHRSAAQRGPAHVEVQPEAEPPGCLGETATDPIKVQSDVEARVSQLADSLLTQLHTNRDCCPLQGAMTAGPQLPSLPSSIQETRGDNRMLRGAELKMQLMQQEASPESTKSAPHTLQNQPEYQQGHFQSSQSEFSQPCSDLSQSHQHHPHSTPPRFQQLRSSPAVFQQKPVPSHKVRCQTSETNKALQSQSARGQQRPVGRSMLEEAGQVLFHVQRRKKILEDNLETLLNVKNGEILTCQLEALAANRDPTKEVQIKKTVDAWISILDTEVQTCELSPSAAAGKSSQDAVHRRPAGAAASQVRSAGRGKPRQTRTRGLGAGHRVLQEAELSAVTPRSMGQQDEVDAEVYLTRLYGKLPCEGLRRTLKKSPYPRFSSSAFPLSKKPHPRLVESIRGVRLKSRKTQTSLAPAFSLSAGPHLHHRISSAVNSSSHDVADVTDAPPHSFPVAMAIPLARPRMDSSRHDCAQHPGPLSARMVRAEQEAAEQQQRPGEEKPPSSPPPTVDILDAEPLRNQEEEHENVLPGDDVNHLSSLCSSEEVCEIGEEAMLLDRGHGGPALPPGSPSPPHAQNVTPVLGVGQHDALEARLVEWVKEQLMSRMYFDLHRPPVSDPLLYLADSEEPSRSSDIIGATCSAEAAREDGLQLLVDSNTQVDSELIRLLVNEVLTETVAQVLGQRDASAAEQGPGLDVSQSGLLADDEENLEVAVPTPVPTPLSGVTQSSREATPVTTPPSSEASSPVSKEPPQPITAPEPAATPTPSSDPKGSPTAPQAQPQLTWGDPECPLEEERPEQQLDPDKQQLIMSVTEEEPPVCSPVPPPPPPPPPSQPAPLESRLASPSSSVEDLSSCSSSTTVTAETEAALKHISEAEVLLGVKQLGSLMEEEAVHSFSSSLHELQDMDFDPTTLEPVRGHNLLLTLLTKMDEGVAHRGERLQPEGSWRREEEEEDEVSVGEVKPLHAENSLLLGSTSSSGKISPAAAEGEEEEDIHPACIRPLEDGGVVAGERVGEPPGAASATDSSTTDVF